MEAGDNSFDARVLFSHACADRRRCCCCCCWRRPAEQQRRMGSPFGVGRGAAECEKNPKIVFCVRKAGNLYKLCAQPTNGNTRHLCVVVALVARLKLDLLACSECAVAGRGPHLRLALGLAHSHWDCTTHSSPNRTDARLWGAAPAPPPPPPPPPIDRSIAMRVRQRRCPLGRATRRPRRGAMSPLTAPPVRAQSARSHTPNGADARTGKR